jgi:hypothetical protein
MRENDGTVDVSGATFAERSGTTACCATSKRNTLIVPLVGPISPATRRCRSVGKYVKRNMCATATAF